MAHKPFMQELITREHIESGKVLPGIAFTMAKLLLARTIIHEMDDHAGHRGVNAGRLVVVKRNDTEVVELSQTLDARPSDRHYSLHLATEDTVFNYHITPKARVVVRAEFDNLPQLTPNTPEERQRATAIGFVTAGEILGLSQYVGSMQAMELPRDAEAQVFGQPR